MNNYFYFILLLAYTICYGHDNKIEKSDNLKIIDYSEKGNPFQAPYYYKRDRYDEQKDSDRVHYDYRVSDKYDEEYVGNPDFDAKIERPCRVFDLNCIRKYFAEHSMCKIRRGPLPRNLFISQESLYFPRVNLTATLANVRFGGIRSTRIEEFYINRRTNKMVFSINIRGLLVVIPTAYFQFYRNASEPIVIVTEVAAFFPSLTLTAVIPNTDNFELKNAEITPYVDSVPAFYLGPELLISTDPTVIQTLVEFLADVSTDTQELMLTESQLYPPAYIQYNICDFGLNVLSVDNTDNIFTIQG